MEIAKALILADRGRDDRPWATAPTGAKHLFAVANRPIVSHCLSALAAAGVLEATICAAGEPAAELRRFAGDGRAWGLNLSYADWCESEGVGAALARTRAFCADEPVLVLRGDALLRDRVHGFIAAFARDGLDAVGLELPAGAAGYLLAPDAVAALREQPGEPLATLRARGARVRVEEIDGCLACKGGHDGLLEANRRLLEGMGTAVDPASLEASTLQGAAVIHKTARVERSLIRGPVVIGPGAHISDAYVGPYTAVGAGVRLEGSQVEHSIILPDAELRFLGTRLESSIIGRAARIVRAFDLPGAIRMSVGEGAEVTLS